MEAGIDSLSAVELKNALTGNLEGMKLPGTLMFDYPTPRRIAGYILATLAPPTTTVRVGAADGGFYAPLGGISDLEGRARAWQRHVRGALTTLRVSGSHRHLLFRRDGLRTVGAALVAVASAPAPLPAPSPTRSPNRSPASSERGSVGPAGPSRLSSYRRPTGYRSEG